MSHSLTRPARVAVSALGVALAVTGLSTPTWAAPDGSAVVISEVYGGGGNAGAPYSNDFIELYNPTTTDVSLEGHVLEYFAASGNSGGKVNLAGTVPAKGHFLIQAAAGSNAAAALPTPDGTSTLQLGATNGSVELRTGSGTVLDLVGFGSATRKEGAAAPALSNALAAQRSAAGTDTDDNSVDFTAAGPVPQNSGRTTDPDPDPDPDADPVDATIAEIQGTGATTPLAGKRVRTRGVVTAAYPSGGFNGFYVQTPGEDTTPDASDGIFVHSPGFADTVVPGASVEVVGVAGEYQSTTQVSAQSADVTVLGTSLGTVVMKTSVPGTDCALPGTDCLDPAALDAAREKIEGEALQLSGDFTVTDAYDGSAYNGGTASSANFGEIGLAAGSDVPLLTPTEVVDPHDAAAIAARKRYNDAHRVILDDGSSLNYSNAANTALPMPWHTGQHQVRVGAAVTFPAPVVLDQRFGWKLQPTSQVQGAPSATQPQFEQTRKGPEAVKGELKLATFNVLNYFTTLGDSLGSTCTSYNDRAGEPVTVNRCDSIPNGPRGAWDAGDLARQQAKIVTAINTLDADVVSLEEIENSRTVDGHDRDEAISTLVDALNAAAGETRWSFAASPADVPASEDVIRTGFIYDPTTVEVAGDSQILIGATAFDNARQPLAQAFKPKSGEADETFAVVVNHFKSKGSGTNDGTGQGNANPDRVAQAKALLTFAETFADARGTDKVFLTGDFNAYSKEDPVVEIEKGGYTRLESSFPGVEKSYSFDGASGSLDHVFASAAARAWVDEVDVWESNANETVYNQYSRHNYNVTELVDASAYSASDHNPEIVGFTPSATAPSGAVDVQIVSTNDFHGRLDAASALAGAVGQLRADEPNTLFVGAGDQIGASTFESFIAKDKPTIDVLNAMGLDVSATGNHEFDAGYQDLVGRVMSPYDATSNPDGGAEWQYLASNVRKKSDDSYALGDVQASPGASDGAAWMTEVDGVKIGFVGAVTEDLGALVSPSGISELKITSIIDEVNAAADRLTADGADAVVLLTHEGAADDKPETASDPDTAFGRIVNGVDGDVDAIFSGHTHLKYAHTIEGRPVISAGEYGTHLSKVVFSVDPATDALSVKANEVVEVAKVSVTDADAVALKDEVAGIVAAAKTEAGVLGAKQVGEIDAPLKRAVLSTGSENRGGESTLGNLVAEVHRWATRGDAQGGAQIAFMNPGGLRADMVGNSEAGYPAAVTYKQAAAVQPFANTLVNMDLAGARIKEALEQQWQRDAAGEVPARPFLRLGASAGFTYTYDVTRPEGERITGMWLDGKAIEADGTYSVTVNSFLASGGDNFRAFASGTNRADTGQSDLQAMVDYMAATDPVTVDSSQRAVGVVTDDAAHLPGAKVSLTVSSWSFSATDAVRDDEVEVLLDGKQIGSATLDNSVSDQPNDETGQALVEVTLPATITAGTHVLTLKGSRTGTEVTAPITVKEAPAPAKVTPTLTVSVKPSTVAVRTGKAQVAVRVAGGQGSPSGRVEVLDGTRKVGTAAVVNGRATVTVTGLQKLGRRTLTVRYTGDAQRLAASTAVKVTVVKKTPKVVLKATSTVVQGKKATVRLTVTAPGHKVSGKVRVKVVQKGRTSVRTVTLKGGKATLKVKVTRSGKATVKATYLGNSTLKKMAARSAKVKVTRARR